MNKYEMTVVVNVKLEEEERAAVIEKCKKYIERYSGTVVDVDEWGKKKLAYDIQKMSEAYYYFIHFESENPNCPNDVERHMRILDNVLRYLILKQEA